jgi:hypothetical protein
MSISASNSIYNELRSVYILHSQVLTALGTGASFWTALCEGKSGLRPLCEVFPKWFPGDQRSVGALKIEQSESRLKVILSQLLSLFNANFWPFIDSVYAATSLGDLIGESAGAPQEVIQKAIQKPVRIISSACSSGSDALSLGTLAIRAGKADVLLILAVDSLCPAKLAHHIALGTQSPTRARPFDKERDGTSFGEGGAFLILANARGVEKLKQIPEAEILNVGFSCDGYDITIPDPTGQWAALAIRQSLNKGIKPDYINAHGTGTIFNDLAESKAFLSTLDLSNSFVSSTKGALGHCLGAAGLIESIISIRALQTGFIPPTAGLRKIDPSLGFKPLIETDRVRASLQTALSVTFGFGGVNSSITMRKIS